MPMPRDAPGRAGHERRRPSTEASSRAYPAVPGTIEPEECPRELPGAEGIVGVAKPMLEVYRMVARVAPTRSTVLVHGETGTGKELVARAIHRASRRGHRPFVTVDCGALAESLLESELFGHVKGAFTGAVADKRGFFEAASGGTCFLDEIAGISSCMQARLLRVLQEHEVRRVGGTDSVAVDVRIIAATNRDLAALVADGCFREDLFYRLSVVTIGLPPLRERREDIALLARHFLESYAAANDRPGLGISPAALALLEGYSWPGNVRELEHAIEHAAALTPSPVILPEDLPSQIGAVPSLTARADSPLRLRDVVTGHLRRVLKEARWNKKLAAQLLGIPRRSLYRLTKRHGISTGEPE